MKIFTVLFALLLACTALTAQSNAGYNVYKIVSAEHNEYDEDGQEITSTTPIFYEEGAKLLTGISNIVILYTYNKLKSKERFNVCECDDAFEIDLDMNNIYKFENGSRGVLDMTSNTFTMEFFDKKTKKLAYTNVIYITEYNDKMTSDKP